MLKEKDLIIRVLEYADKKGAEGFWLNKMYDEEEFDLSEDEKRYIELWTCDYSQFNGILSKLQDPSDKQLRPVPRYCKYVITLDGKFKLLEYVELQEARKASKEATDWATRAFIVSIIALIASVGFSIAQIIIDNNV